MEELITVLVQRLVDSGPEPIAVPAFVRNLSHIIVANPNIGIAEVNRELVFLGWGGVELDNVTYQLSIALFEPDFDEVDFQEESPETYYLPMAVQLAG